MLCRAYRLVSINIQEVPGGQDFIGLNSALCNYREWAPNPEKGWIWGLWNASPEDVRSEQDVNDAQELHRGGGEGRTSQEGGAVPASVEK